MIYPNQKWLQLNQINWKAITVSTQLIKMETVENVQSFTDDCKKNFSQSNKISTLITI